MPITVGMNLVSFVAGGTTMAIDARAVLRIVPAAGLRPFPAAAALLDFEGRKVAVFDVRPLTRDATHVILVSYATSVIGVRAEGPPQHHNASPATLEADGTSRQGVVELLDGTRLVVDLGAALRAAKLHEAIAIADAMQGLEPS